MSSLFSLDNSSLSAVYIFNHYCNICFSRYATEVDVDFVRKSVRAIGRCAIKVEPSAERCVSTLLDLIQTKVNYVVQEAVVVIKVTIQTINVSCYLCCLRSFVVLF